MADSSSAADIATISAPRRDRTKLNVRAPAATTRAMMSAASALALRRTGAPCSPSWPSTKPGSHNAMVRAPAGEPSSVTVATFSRPVSRRACAAGSVLVAEARMRVGSVLVGRVASCLEDDVLALGRTVLAALAPTTRSSRRSTIATCAPNTPRYTCASSMTT